MNVFCPICEKKMKTYYHFETGKSYTYMACDNCHFESKPGKIFFREIKGMDKFEDELKEPKMRNNNKKFVKSGKNERRVSKWA